MTYKSRPQLFVPSETDPTPHRNAGWRRNYTNWQKKFDHPSRPMYLLLEYLKTLAPNYNLKVIVFDPMWHGRFDNCVDGSPIMFTAEIFGEDESNCYLDLRSKDGSANRPLYSARTAYCERNKIDLIVLYEHWTQSEMKWAIESWLRNHTKKEE